MTEERCPKNKTDTAAADVDSETTPEDIPKTRSELNAVLEIAGKLIARLGVICYLAGIIVLNIYLGQHGYFTIDLLNSHYILVGIWALMPLFLSWILLSLAPRSPDDAKKFFARRIEELKEEFKEEFENATESELKEFDERKRTALEAVLKKLDKLRRIRRYTGVWGMIIATVMVTGEKQPKWISAWIAAILLGLLSVVSILIALLVLFKYELYKSYELVLPPVLIGWYMRLLAMTLLAGFLVDNLLMKPNSISELARRILNERLLTFLILIAYLLIVSRFLYPAIPSHLGGGRPQQVRLVVDHAKQQDLIAGGLNFPKDSVKSDPVGLLLATSEDYILLAGNRKVIEVRRELTQMIIYESR